jgi:hypothetical protein
MSMRTLPIIIAVGLLVGLGACSAGGGMVPPADVPSASAAAAGVAAGGCPPHNPAYVLNPGRGLSDNLVPVTARKLVLCRYSGMNATPALALAVTEVISDAGAVDTWRQRFNSLPAGPSGTRHCPAGFGESILAGFVAITSYTVVKVELLGCGLATNGSIIRDTYQATDPTFVTDLEALTGCHSARPDDTGGAACH